MKLDEFLSRLAAEPPVDLTSLTYVYFVEPANVVAPIMNVSRRNNCVGDENVATAEETIGAPRETTPQHSSLALEETPLSEVVGGMTGEMPNVETRLSRCCSENSNCCHDIQPIDRIRPNDVISGRSRRAWNHDGNHRFRSIINDNVQRFIDASNHQEKAAITESVVDELLYEGRCRFVKIETDEDSESSSSSKFEILTRREIHEKVSQALRDLAKSYRRQSHCK